MVDVVIVTLAFVYLLITHQNSTTILLTISCIWPLSNTPICYIQIYMHQTDQSDELNGLL